MQPVSVVQGNSPLVLGFPHTGTWMPPEIAMRLNENGKILADTDWHIDRLYEGLRPGITSVRASFHRYVIDANRDPSGASLYPGQNTTGLVPLSDFDGQPIWLAGEEPDEAEIAFRCEHFHAPYHATLSAQLRRIHSLHGYAILYDCHSIRSRIPFLFDGVLPDFNIGDNGGTTCDAAITAIVADACALFSQYSNVVNGRFKGGWTTRHYGKPQEGYHAIQMELAQSTHLASQKQPFAYDPGKAGKLREALAKILESLAGWRPVNA